jgi:predicted acetyltransferase
VPARDTAFDIRVLGDDDLRTASTLFRESLHLQPLDDEQWATWRGGYEPGRSYGAFAGDVMIGTVTSLATTMTVPGGAALPMAAVTAVGVRADHRRRGALTAMMRRQLEDLAAAGEPFATLHASEPTIYGRFGYGVGTLGRTVKVRSSRARLRDEVPTAGTVRLLTTDEALTLLPGAYPPLQPGRAAMMSRPPSWWVINYARRFTHEYLRVAAHHGAGGTIDGWVAYRPVGSDSDDPRVGNRLIVLDFQAAGHGVANDLWRYLIGIDLVEEITAYLRPADDPIQAMVADLFALRAEVEDELYVRLVDVPRALAAREYGAAEPVAVEVVDPLLPNNSGTYLISPHGTEPASGPAQLTVTAEILAMVYLGTWRPSDLAAIGRLAAHDPSALAAADRLFGTDRPAWCGSLF